VYLQHSSEEVASHSFNMTGGRDERGNDHDRRSINGRDTRECARGQKYTGTGNNDGHVKSVKSKKRATRVMK
jgi:hypothetical protein